MHKRFLTLVDYIAFGLLGTAAGEHLAWRFLYRYPGPTPVEAGAIIMGALVVFLVFHAKWDTAPGRVRYRLYVLPAYILFMLAGALIGARLVLLVYRARLPVSQTAYVSLVLLAGLVWTIMLFQWTRQPQAARVISMGHAEDAGDAEGLVNGVLLPAAAVTIVATRWGFDYFIMDLLAVLGAVSAMPLAMSTTSCVGPPVTRHFLFPREKRLLALTIASTILYIMGRGIGPVLDSPLRDVLLLAVLVSIGTIVSTLGGAVLAGKTAQETLFAADSSPLVYAANRSLKALWLAAPGAIVGAFVGTEFRPVIGWAAPFCAWLGALVGAAVGFPLFTVGQWDPRARAGRFLPAPTSAETACLALAYVAGAVPVGCALFAGALFYGHSVVAYFPVIVGLVCGPVIGGTLATLWVVSRLYKPGSYSDWLAWLWAWSVTGFFLFAFHEEVIRILDLYHVIEPALYAASATLALLAVWELLVSTTVSQVSLESHQD